MQSFCFFLSDTFATNPHLLSVWDVNVKLTQHHWDLPDFMSELDLLLANGRLQLIQTHSEAQQMLLWASFTFENGNKAWNQVLSLLPWIMDFILFKTLFTHLLVYHFQRWYGVKYQVLPDKWWWDSRSCSLLYGSAPARLHSTATPSAGRSEGSVHCTDPTLQKI